MSIENKICLNCDYQLDEEAMYCARCGQKYSRKNGTVRDFFVDFLGDYFTFDSKIFRSILPLITKPGFLTTEYLIGRRVRYIPPLRLYIFISIIFFLIFKFANPFSGTVMDQENVMSQDMIDYFVDNHWHKVFFVLLPLFAFIVFLFYRRVYNNYLPHFIFSLHFHSFLFILLSCYILVTAYVTKDYYQLNQLLFLLIVLAYYLYLFFALKNVFKESVLKVLLKLLGIGVAYTIINLSATILALTVYYQLKS
ncbi:MAG: DUF3667 domain-containing protein [Bacteroidota bacterium]